MTARRSHRSRNRGELPRGQPPPRRRRPICTCSGRLEAFAAGVPRPGSDPKADAAQGTARAIRARRKTAADIPTIGPGHPDRGSPEGARVLALHRHDRPTSHAAGAPLVRRPRSAPVGSPLTRHPWACHVQAAERGSIKKHEPGPWRNDAVAPSTASGLRRREDRLRHAPYHRRAVRGREPAASGRRIINYDLPWNPMRLVQRHGRIDRIGSRHARSTSGASFPSSNLDELLGLEETIERKIAYAAVSVGVGEGPPG